MFKDNDKMRPGPTPERVLAICRLVSDGEYTQQEIYHLSTLDKDLKNPDESLRNSISIAEELQLIEKSNGKYKLIIAPKNIESSETFRRMLNQLVYNNKNSLFFKMTEWFICNSDIVQATNKFDELAAEAAKSGIPSINENDVLGWRLWVRFLGHAYQYNKTLIPNMKIRLQDAFSSLKPGTKMSAAKFITWIKENIPESALSCNQEKLSLSMSNGLRVLNTEGYIKLNSTMDAGKVKLYPLVGIEPNDFSEIEIKGEK